MAEARVGKEYKSEDLQDHLVEQQREANTSQLL